MVHYNIFSRGVSLTNEKLLINTEPEFKHLYHIYYTTTCKCNISVNIRLKSAIKPSHINE